MRVVDKSGAGYGGGETAHSSYTVPPAKKWRAIAAVVYTHPQAPALRKSRIEAVSFRSTLPLSPRERIGKPFPHDGGQDTYLGRGSLGAGHRPCARFRLAGLLLLDGSHRL